LLPDAVSSQCHGEYLPLPAEEKHLPVPVDASRILIVDEEEAIPDLASTVGLVQLLRGDILRYKHRLVHDDQR